MIPYRDENETLRTPVVTLSIVAVNVVVLIKLFASSRDVRSHDSRQWAPRRLGWR